MHLYQYYYHEELSLDCRQQNEVDDLLMKIVCHGSHNPIQLHLILEISKDSEFCLNEI